MAGGEPGTVATVKLKHTAWQATGSFFLTGEKNSFGAPRPKKPFDPKAGTLRRARAGRALQRAQHRRRDVPDLRQSATSSPSKAKAWAVGPQLVSRASRSRSSLDYEHTTFTGGAATGDREAGELRRHPRPALLLMRAPREARARPCALDSPSPARSLLLALDGRRRPGRRPGTPKPVTLLNVSYDPTRELYEDFNQQFAAYWKAQDRPGRDDPPVARRLGQAGALGHRRPRRRRRDAGAGLRHRRRSPTRPGCCRPTGRRACPTTARPTPRPSCSWSARATRRASRTGATSPSPASR